MKLPWHCTEGERCFHTAVSTRGNTCTPAKMMAWTRYHQWLIDCTNSLGKCYPIHATSTETHKVLGREQSQVSENRVNCMIFYIIFSLHLFYSTLWSLHPNESLWDISFICEQLAMIYKIEKRKSVKKLWGALTSDKSHFRCIVSQ